MLVSHLIDLHSHSSDLLQQNQFSERPPWKLKASVDSHTCALPRFEARHAVGEWWLANLEYSCDCKIIRHYFTCLSVRFYHYCPKLLIYQGPNLILGDEIATCSRKLQVLTFLELFVWRSWWIPIFSAGSVTSPSVWRFCLAEGWSSACSPDKLNFGHIQHADTDSDTPCSFNAVCFKLKGMNLESENDHALDLQGL